MDKSRELMEVCVKALDDRLAQDIEVATWVVINTDVPLDKLREDVADLYRSWQLSARKEHA